MALNPIMTLFLSKTICDIFVTPALAPLRLLRAKSASVPSRLSLQFPAGTFPTASHKKIASFACVGGLR